MYYKLFYHDHGSVLQTVGHLCCDCGYVLQALRHLYCVASCTALVVTGYILQFVGHLYCDSGNVL